MIFIDSHCHLPNLHHKDDLDRILIDAKSWGVEIFINIGTSITENTEAIEVAQNYESVYASVGIFPHEHRGEDVEELIDQLEVQAISSKKVVAIGECGIDVTQWKNQRPLEEQLTLFEAQIKLAQKLNLPIIVHNRNGDDIVLQTLSRYYKTSNGTTGVIHCFDSAWQVAQQFLNLGFYISFSGCITYESHQYLQEVAQKIPSDRYLLETDSPYLLPEPAKSQSRAKSVNQKNTPKYVRMVGQKVAEVRQISLEEVAEKTRTNANKLFGLPA